MLVNVNVGSSLQERKVCECACPRETAWESLRLQKRETLTVCFVLVWVYFERERFESGFRDLTLCVKVLRRLLLRRFATGCAKTPRHGWAQGNGSEVARRIVTALRKVGF